MSEHQLAAFVYGVDAEVFRKELGAEYCQEEETGCTIVSSTSPPVSVLNVWFPDDEVYAALGRITATKVVWIDEYFSKGVDWDRRRLLSNGEHLYEEGVTIGGELYVAFEGETRSCQPERPTRGLIELATRARTQLAQQLGEAAVVLPFQFGTHVVLEGSEKTSAGHPLDEVLEGPTGLKFPEPARDLTLLDDDIPF